MQAALRESLVLYFRNPPDSPSEGPLPPDLELARVHHDADETQLTPEMVADIVFALIPRFATVPASEASHLVAELRPFFVHLARELDSPRPFACAHALDGRADEQLEAALGDPDRYGILKSAVMAGLDEGYDVHTVAGLQAWFDRVESIRRSVSRLEADHARRARRRNRDR